jgi:hypothetical protein
MKLKDFIMILAEYRKFVTAHLWAYGKCAYQMKISFISKLMKRLS